MKGSLATVEDRKRKTRSENYAFGDTKVVAKGPRHEDEGEEFPFLNARSGKDARF